MTALRPAGRRGRSLAAALALAVGLAACGRKQVPADAYDPDGAVAPETAAPPPAAAPAPAAAAAPGAAPAAAPLTPEQDSAREAQAFRRRQQSMESYESCIAKSSSVEEPVRTTLKQACARSRGARP
jgi:hypothetical protein